MTDRPRQAGFTTNELAVVLGLILLMVGLTLPAISRAMRKGRMAETVNTLQGMHQQAMLAAQQYRMNWGVTPPGGITLSVVAGETLRLKIGDTETDYAIPNTIECGIESPPTASSTPITTISYQIGTGLPALTGPKPYFFMRTTDGKDRVRVFVSASGLAKVENL